MKIAISSVKRWAQIALVAGTVGVFGQVQAAAKNGAFDATQKQQIGQIVRDYLLNNPEVLVEVSQKLQEKQQQQMRQVEEKAQKAIPEIANELFNAKTSPVVGNAEGDVTVVEFFDYQCPHCKSMQEVVGGLLSKDGNVRVVYKEFPIFGNSSVFASKAALAAMKQGKYEQLHTALMDASNPLTSDKVLQAAKQAGLNIDQLKKDMDSAEVKQELSANLRLAQKLNLMGTPAFVVGSTKNGSDANSKSFFVPGGTTEDVLVQLVGQVRNQ